MGSLCAKRAHPLDQYKVFQKYEFSGIKLGIGATCQVHEAIEKGKGTPFAIKVIVKTEAHASGKNELALQKEVDIMRRVKHENICRFYETFEDALILYFVLECCEGGSLFDKLEHDIVLEEPVAMRMSQEMLRAIAHLHDFGIVHRDLKPESWLLTDFSEDARIRLSSFGSAEYCNTSSPLSQSCGTLHYVAPEVLRGKYDHSCDVWTLGVLLFLMVYGSYPFDGDSCSLVMRSILSSEPDWSDSCYELSSEVRKLLKMLLVKNPDQRPTAHQSANHPWFAGLNNITKQTSLPRKVSKSSRRSSARSSARQSVSNVPELKSAPGQARKTSFKVTDDLLRQIAADAMSKFEPSRKSVQENNATTLITHPYVVVTEELA